MPRPREYVYLVITKAGGVEKAFESFTAADEHYSHRFPFMDQYEWEAHPEHNDRWTKPMDFRHTQIMIQRVSMNS